jgi:PHD/YefM family antitoxin component YafN of YafNO toxin-antitoxin module
MTFVPYRVLRNTPGELRRRLKESGHLVLTSDGKPFAVLVSVEEGELEETLELLTRLRAQQALRRLRAEAQRNGLDRLSPEEIEAEIEAVRREH